MYYDFQEVEICISLVFRSYKTHPIMAIDNFPWTMFLRWTLNVKKFTLSTSNKVLFGGI
jgi:hypothetical protein